MPKYSYRCSECGNEFETTQSINDEPLKECPKCKKALIKLIGKNIGVTFKGTGFYVNDSKKKGS